MINHTRQCHFTLCMSRTETMGTFVPANIIRVIRIKQSRTTGVYKSAIPPEIGHFQIEAFEQCRHQHLIVSPVAQ